MKAEEFLIKNSDWFDKSPGGENLYFESEVIRMMNEYANEVRRCILGALNEAKKNCLALKNTPHIESRGYALAHGKLECINNAIDIVKKYYAQ